MKRRAPFCPAKGTVRVRNRDFEMAPFSSRMFLPTLAGAADHSWAWFWPPIISTIPIQPRHCPSLSHGEKKKSATQPAGRALSTWTIFPKSSGECIRAIRVHPSHSVPSESCSVGEPPRSAPVPFGAVARLARWSHLKRAARSCAYFSHP